MGIQDITQDIAKVEPLKLTDMAILYAGDYGLKVISAILIFVIGRWITARITNVTKLLLVKSKIDPTLVEFAESLTYFVLIVVVMLASLNTLGINTTSFLAVFGAASLAIGLALKDSLGNIGAAVLIIIFRPFKVGDFVEAGGAKGTVEDVNLFSTIIAPLDNRTIIVPNSAIIAKNITNFSKKTRRRVDHFFTIGYDDDLRLAKKILLDLMHEDSRVLQDPPPFVAVGNLGERGVEFTFRAWAKKEDYWGVYFDMPEKVKLAFDENNISIPYPQLNVHTDT